MGGVFCRMICPGFYPKNGRKNRKPIGAAGEKCYNKVDYSNTAEKCNKIDYSNTVEKMLY